MIALNTSDEVETAINIVQNTAFALANTPVSGKTLAETAEMMAQVKRILDACHKLYRMNNPTL